MRIFEEIIVDKDSIALADRATQIARERRINFGDALFAARREFADVVQQNTGSPLRTQNPSTMPDPAKVRAVVEGGLQAISWDVSPETGKVAAFSIFGGVFEVGGRLSDLGLGPQIISSLKIELNTFLNYAFATQGAKPSDVIPQAADHMAAVYKQALANKVETQVWAEDRTARLVTGVALRDRAEKLSTQRNISFGEALSIARREINMAADASLDPDQLAQAITGDVTNAVNSIFDGKTQIIWEQMDSLKVMEAVKKALARLDIGTLVVEPTKAAETALDVLLGSKVNMPNKIAEKVVAAIQKAYATAVASAT